MQAVSDEFKELAKSNARISLAKFVIKDSNTEIDGETIIDGFIEEMTCDNTSLVGNVMAKNLETSIYNNFTNDFIGKEIYAYTGQQLEDETEEYVPRGTFIIDELEEDVSSGSLKLKGLDYTIKFNKAWEDSLDWENNTYTLGDFAKAVCEFCDLELETEEFSNSDYVLTEQPAFQGYQCRYVMQRIAEIATSNVFISPEDKVQIRLAPQNYVSAEGSSITLEESANSRLKIDEFDGEITQETTTGKNITEPYVNNGTLNGITCSYDAATQTYTFNGTCTKDNTTFRVSNTDINVINGTTRGSAHWVSGSVTGYCTMRYYNYAYSLSLQYDLGVLSSSNPIAYGTSSSSFTSPANRQSLRFNNGSVANNLKVKFMVAQSLDTTYEPFTNGPSPNPDYPQNINVVSGDNYINICGKNLVDIADRTITSQYAVENINTKSISGNITLSLNFVNNNSVNGVIRLREYGSNTNLKSLVLEANQSGTRSISLDVTSYNAISIIFQGVSSGYNYSISNVMLAKGTDTDYEPYIEHSYPLYLGVENLFDISTNTDGKVLASNGAITDDVKFTISDYIKVLPNTKYTISWVYDSSQGSDTAMRVGYYQSDKTFISRPYNPTSPYTITTPNNCYYIRLCYEISSHTQIQVELGDKENSFTPYGTTPIELCKIGTYQDYIYKDNGSWYLHKEIERINITSSMTWYKSGTTAVDKYYTRVGNWDATLNKFSYCNRFIYKDSGVAIGEFDYSQNNTYLALFFCYATYNTSTINTFKTWLDSNEVYCYVPVVTPTNTEITNNNYPELLSQLKAIEKARSLDGITYIDVDSANLPFNLSLQYDQKVSEDIDINSIMSLEVEDTSYKPYNAVTLALADGIEGENVTLRDESSIALYGERALVITANEFAINQAVREELIEEMFNSINGFNYVPMKLEYNSYDWLERYDRIRVQYDEDMYYETYLFNHTTEFPSTIKSVIEDVAINETKVKYEFVPEEQQKTLHAEVVVDKLNGAVEALASESEDNFSSIRLDIDGIKSEVQSLNVENDELGNEIEVVRSSITEQTSTAITDWFDSNLKSQLEDLQNTTESNSESLNNIKSYVRRGIITDAQSPYYNQAYVEIGDETNQTTLRILPNRIQFLTNGQETAFISNNQLYINESTILTKEKVGHWVTTEDENGLLNTYWED